ncbi:MAG: hypothetical protein WCK09_11940 [Bacteroidota bacterium]
MKKIAISWSLAFIMTTLQAQSPNIQIGIGQDWPNEPSVCMNPLNPDQILIGTVPDNYYTSEDGGLTWEHGIITSAYGVNGDPVVLADTQGNFYYFHLVPDLSRFVCQRKHGISSAWGEESFTAIHNDYDIDKEWATYNPITNSLYKS